LLQLIFSLNFPTRLIVTDGAQCGAWNTWAATNKRSRNAKINHSENPSNSDAVQFFLHVVSNPPYNIFNMPDSLYQHFENLLSTPDKPLQLTAQNFASKVNPQRKYPECVVNTGSLFDEDGDPIFTMPITSSPASPAPVGTTQKGSKKTGASLKRTLASASKRKRQAKKLAAEGQLVDTAQPTPTTPATAPTPTLEPATPIIQPPPELPTPPKTPKAKPLTYPTLLALPSKTAVPLNDSDRQFLEYSFLPICDLKGNNIVLVSRAFSCSNITLHGSYLAIRQVF